jgi:hypothetical protein
LSLGPIVDGFFSASTGIDVQLRTRRRSGLRCRLNRIAPNRSIVKIGPLNSLDDRDDGPTVGASCRCLNLWTSIGGTRNKVEGGDRHDLEPEGMREDTGHKIYTGSSSQSSYPTSCLEYIAPCAWCCSPEGLGCAAGYPTLLYIVQGAGA